MNPLRDEAEKVQWDGRGHGKENPSSGCGITGIRINHGYTREHGERRKLLAEIGPLLLLPV